MEYIIKSIVVDTVNAIQNLLYSELLRKKGKATHDDWTDYGVDIYLFMEALKDLGFELVLILGKEGSGKSYGMKGLPEGSYLWYNADKKNCTYIRTETHKQLYGNKKDPGILMRIPTKYSDIVSDCAALSRGVAAKDFSIKLDENPVAFLIGHTEEYKSTDGEIRQRLRVLGKLATKMQIEGQVEHCYYSEMRIENGKPKGYLRTQNSGNDTARSPEGMYSELYIPNDYNLIINAINNA